MKKGLKRFSILLKIIITTFIFIGCSAEYTFGENKNDKLKEMTPAKAYEFILKILEKGKQDKAENFIELYVKMYPKDQRLAFLQAACIRSRFMIGKAYPLFSKVVKMNKKSVPGQCSEHMLYLDSKRDIKIHFEALRNLVNQNPDDIIARWMIAVQCRSYDKNKEGVKHYKEILKKWDPGPVLVHQTYANLLDELKLYKEALVHRKMAVKLEPASWSYHGLACTFCDLKQYKEASETYKKAIEFAPNRPDYWRAWGWGLYKWGKYEEAIKKFKKATELNPKDDRAWNQWGICLKRLERYEEALDKYYKAIEVNPHNKYPYTNASYTLEILGKNEEAKKLLKKRDNITK
jgi:tetratricopeptide (TPR) repeat protein